MTRGRKVMGEKKVKRTNFTMTQRMFDDVRILALVKGISLNDVIRLSVAELIARERDLIEQSREKIKGCDADT